MCDMCVCVCVLCVCSSQVRLLSLLFADFSPVDRGSSLPFQQNGGKFSPRSCLSNVTEGDVCRHAVTVRSNREILKTELEEECKAFQF